MVFEVKTIILHQAKHDCNMIVLMNRFLCCPPKYAAKSVKGEGGGLLNNKYIRNLLSGVK